MPNKNSGIVCELVIIDSKNKEIPIIIKVLGFFSIMNNSKSQ